MIKYVGFLFFINVLSIQCLACVFKDVAPGLQAAKIKNSNIYTAFAYHINHPMAQSIFDSVAIKDKQQSVVMIKKSLENSKQYILQQRRKANYLKQLIDTKKIDWLGVEWSSKQVEASQKSIDDYIYSKIFLIRKYGDAFSEQEIEDILSMIFAEDTRLLGQYKMKKQPVPIKILPLEHNSIKDKTLKAMDISERMFGELHKKRIDPNVPTKIRNAIDGVLNEFYKNINTIGDYDMRNIEMYSSQIHDPETKKMVQDFIRHKQKEAMLHYRRDVSMATTASKLKGNGLIILGSAHKTGFLSEMTSICKSSLRFDEGYSEGIE